jgi:uncharacterized membrane protein YdjX (TVP38/TMEM64 family)
MREQSLLMTKIIPIMRGNARIMRSLFDDGWLPLLINILMPQVPTGLLSIVLCLYRVHIIKVTKLIMSFSVVQN